MSAKVFSLFLFSILLITNSFAANGRMQRAKNAADKRKFQVEAFDQYDFSLCQKFAKDNENYYLFSCDDSKLITSPITNLERSQYRISKKIYSDNFLKELKDYTLSSLKKNKEEINSTINCLNSSSTDCKLRIEKILDYIKGSLPSYRKTMALSELYTVGGRGYTFHNIKQDLEHDSLDYDIPKLSDLEYEEAVKLKKEIVFNIKQDALASIEDECISFDYEYKMSNCSRAIKGKLRSETSKGVEKVRDLYKEEYNKRTNLDPLLARLNIRGDEPRDKIIKELKKQLIESSKANQESFEKITSLEDDDDLIDLIKNKNSVQGYLSTQGVTKASCDIAQSLYDEVETDKLMASLYIGGAAIVGGGICLGTLGIGCAIGVGVVAEGVDLYMQQNQLNNSRLSFESGLGTVDAIESAESDRNLALAFVAVGSAGNLLRPAARIAKNSYVGSKKSIENTFEARKSKIELSEIRNFNPKLKENFSSVSELKKAYSDYALTTPRLNRRWIDNAKKSNASFYLDVENSALKRLNDSLGDKELVTSLTNLHKEVMFKKINELSKKFDGINFEVYSDFKSLRFAFTPKNIPKNLEEKFLKELNTVYKEANGEYAKMVQNLDGLGAEAPALWFEGGIAATADGAGQAAKRSRVINRIAPKLVSFDDIRRLVDLDLESIKAYSSKLSNSSLEKSGLTEIVSGTGVKTVRLEVIETIRKSTGNARVDEVERIFSGRLNHLSHLDIKKNLDADYSRQALSDKFGVVLSNEEAHDLVEYVSKLDGLTPGLWQEVRVSASLDKANFGGFSGDVTGMGARNIQQVARDIATAKSVNAEEVLTVTRLGEQQVTKTFNRIKDNFTTTVKDVFDKRKVLYESKCSGDDCVVIPSSKLERGDEVAIINAFRVQDNPSQYRLSFIPPGVSSEKRTLLATQGELVEKEFRKQIVGVSSEKIPYKKLSQITLGTRMPSTLNKGSIELYLGVGKGISLTKYERELIEKAYERAVKKTNQNLSEEASGTSKILYDSGAVNFIE